MAKFLKSEQNDGETELIEGRFQLDGRAIKKETDVFVDQKLAVFVNQKPAVFVVQKTVVYVDQQTVVFVDRKPAADPGFMGRFKKEKMEKFEVHISSTFETPEDMKPEIKCKERQVSPMSQVFPHQHSPPPDSPQLVLLPIKPLMSRPPNPAVRKIDGGAIKEEADDFLDQKPVTDMGSKGCFKKVKMEEFEVHISSAFETPGDMKQEIKCKERPVSPMSQSCSGGHRRDVEGGDPVPSTSARRSNPPRRARSEKLRYSEAGTPPDYGEEDSPDSGAEEPPDSEAEGTPDSEAEGTPDSGAEDSVTCSQCRKTFTDVRGLRKHRRIHTGERPYRCTHCGKTFTQSAHLVSHRRSHSGEKPYRCAQCGKSFSQSQHLKRHQRLHTGERPHRCTRCGRSFSEKGDLTKHARIHSGEKPFRCTRCGMTFRFSTNLKKHLKAEAC